MKQIFIGYDRQEPVLYHVCSNSIIRHTHTPINIAPLGINQLKSQPWIKDTDGSNDFIYSRFLVPHLMNYNGWALYIDGDMVIKNDIDKIFKYADPSKAVVVAQHNYKTKSKIKYLGNKNDDYPRKNWSSVILWNCGHPENKILQPEVVQQKSGKFLHRFEWLDDNLIGELPLTWNWLADEYGENNNADLVHYTLGAPCFSEYADTEMSSDWHKEKIYTTYCQQTF